MYMYERLAQLVGSLVSISEVRGSNLARMHRTCLFNLGHHSRNEEKHKGDLNVVWLDLENAYGSGATRPPV